MHADLPAPHKRLSRETVLMPDESIYGPATGQKRLTIKTPIKNLYVAGSGVMGGGVEAAAIAGIHAANEIYKN